MSATTDDRNTQSRGTSQVNLGVAANTTIPAGVMVAINASGYALNGADAASLTLIGCALERAANTATGNADGDVAIEVATDCRLWANDDGDPVTIAHIGQRCYVLDNQTVSISGGTYSVIAGIVHDVTADGVWVDHGALKHVPDETSGLTVAVANGDPVNGNATITIQSELAARQVVRAWFSATAYGAPTDLGTLTATTGIILKEDTDDALATIATDANGTAVLNLDCSANSTVHAMVERNGVCATDSEAITGN
jgi:hypothetical protein